MLLDDCWKAPQADLDKACSVQETIRRAEAALSKDKGLLEHIERIDSGRLGIPVYMCYAGPKAQTLIAGHKQMGKGPSPEQAKASALMELVERYSFSAFWERKDPGTICTWSKAKALFADRLMPIEHVLHSVDDDLDQARAERLMDLFPWRFAPVWDLAQERTVYAPIDWFKALNEYNGSSAGNTKEEAILQGLCEVIERHVCAWIDTNQPELPNIALQSCNQPTLKALLQGFQSNGLNLWLKDFSCALPLPTIGALAYDPNTFPGHSDIVFTAGTASSPVNAAIRALTEVAQLGGDFVTKDNYQPSGLKKYSRLEDCSWITQGADRELSTLPNIADQNITNEIRSLAASLQDQDLHPYTLDITHPGLGLPASFSFIAGCDFRERSRHPSLGLYIGRHLAEKAPFNQAQAGLDTLFMELGEKYYIPFYQGLLALRNNDLPQASQYLATALPLQPGAEERALVTFYQGYIAFSQGDWSLASCKLDQSLAEDPNHAALNLRGVVAFKQEAYEQAIQSFRAALAKDRGSAMDRANLGLCHLRLGQHQEAIEELQAALELDPGIDFAKEALTSLLSSSKIK